MSKSSAGRFFYLTTRRNEKWFSGKSTSTKKHDVDGQGFKKERYRVKELVPFYTKKNHQKREKEHPENIRKSPVFHFAMSRMSLLQPCLQQFQNRLPRSTELVGGFPGIGVKQKLCESPLSFEKWVISQTFHQIQRNFWRIWI